MDQTMIAILVLVAVAVAVGIYMLVKYMRGCSHKKDHSCKEDSDCGTNGVCTNSKCACKTTSS